MRTPPIPFGAALLAALPFGACKSTPSFPAPALETVTFDRSATGAPPAGWKAGSTHAASAHATWAVNADADASSAPNVLSLTKTNHDAQDTFNLCWSDEVAFREGVIEVRVRADGGTVDQGGGVMWRVQGPDDYYLCRYNPLEANFRVYLVSGGVRRQLATALAPGAGQGWHAIRVEHVHGHLVCTLDGSAKLDVQDDTLPHVGGVGLWTKADARTSFDDLKVVPAETR